MHKGLDVIGPVSGRAGALTALLSRLGYARRDGTWGSDERHAVFLGGYAGGGPGDMAVVRIVRGMAASGAATALMGRAEFDELVHAHAASAGARGLRGAAGRRHAALVAAIGGEGSPRHAEAVAFYAGLALATSRTGLALAHGCHDAVALSAASCALDASGRLTAAGLAEASRPGTAVRAAAIMLVDGPRAALPRGETRVEGGEVRRDAPARWWAGEGAAPAPPALTRIFARGGEDAPGPGGRVLCLGDAGGVSAYRWDGERDTTARKLLREEERVATKAWPVETTGRDAPAEAPPRRRSRVRRRRSGARSAVGRPPSTVQPPPGR